MIRGPSVALAACVLCLASPARAEDPAVEANRHFQLGVLLFKEKRFEGALVEFERAHAIAPHPLTRLNLGLAYRELTRYDEAIEAFVAVSADPTAAADLVARAGRERDALEQRIGTVTVSSAPEGAEITLDGRVLGATPLSRPYAVPPGLHVVEARDATGRVETRKLSVAAGDKAAVEIAFPTVLVEPPPELDRAPLVELAAPRLIGVRSPSRGPRLGAWTAVISDAASAGETGAPVVGAGVRLGRVDLGVDAVLVAWAVVPTVRVRLVGERVGIHAIAAVPIVLRDGDDTDPFVAGAGGLGVSFAALPWASIYAEGLVSIAAEPHGLTFPVSLGVRAWLD